MKRILLLMTILSISVVTTACISNFAIKELNNKAQDYLNNGDTESAICRLKSSLDLDSELYETHYNLAVAYLAADKQTDAIESLKRVIQLKPDFNDEYYSIGLANATLAYRLIDKENDVNENGTNYMLTSEERNDLSFRLNEAVNNYNRYLANVPNCENASEIKAQIENLTQKLKEISESEQDTGSGASMATDDEIDDTEQ